MDSGDSIFFGVILTIVIVIIIFLAFVSAKNSQQIYEMGSMICSEKGYGNFTSFNIKEKIISCEPTPEPKPITIMEKYDGGYIKVTKNGKN